MIAYFLNGPAAGEVIALPFLGVMKYVACPEGGRYDLIEPAYSSCALYNYTPPKSSFYKFAGGYYSPMHYDQGIVQKLRLRIEQASDCFK